MSGNKSYKARIHAHHGALRPYRVSERHRERERERWRESQRERERQRETKREREGGERQRDKE